MRDFGKFISLCFQEAFRHSRSVVDLFSTSVGIAVPFIQKYWPAWFASHGVTNVSDLAWQIPLGGFAAVTIARILISPYWVWRDQYNKIKLYETSRPAFRLAKAYVPREPQIRWLKEGDKAPIATVGFDLNFRNQGGGVAYQTQFFVFYCWLREPHNVMHDFSGASAGDTLQGECLGWTFVAEQRPATQTNVEKNLWWFDRAGLLMQVMLIYVTDPDTGATDSSMFWLGWSPDRNVVSYAGQQMVDTVGPIIDRYMKEQLAAAGISDNSTSQPLSVPDSSAPWRHRYWMGCREMCARCFDY